MRLDATAKRSAQMAGTTPSESFLKLAERLLEISRGPAAEGASARHLDDGLEKIARGELAPETLRLTSHHKPSQQQKTASGWTLELRGTVASTRPYTRQTGYGNPIRLQLPIEDVKVLAGELAEQHPRSLPHQLASESLTTIAFELLEHKRRFETTRTSGNGATVDAQHKQRIERVTNILQRLHRRILAEGESTAPNLAR